MASGVELIAIERKRQIEHELWSAAHDDLHTRRELVNAAVCYAIGSHDVLDPNDGGTLWPFDDEDWKPGYPITNLVKAGALIAAEIDRLQRLDPQRQKARE